MKVTLKIQRFNPEADKAPWFKEYRVDASPNDRLLDCLMFIKHYIDGSLAFRKSWLMEYAVRMRWLSTALKGFRAKR